MLTKGYINSEWVCQWGASIFIYYLKPTVSTHFKDWR